MELQPEPSLRGRADSLTENLSPNASSAMESPSPLDRKPVRRMSFGSQFGATLTLDGEAFSPLRPTLVFGKLYFKTPFQLEKLRGVLRDRLCALPRFDARPCDFGTHAEYQQLPRDELDMSYHVTEVEQDGAPWSEAEGIQRHSRTP